MDKFLESGFLDSYRLLNPETVKYSWWSFRSNARDKNLGWRLDYHMITDVLEPTLRGTGIMNEARHSDHCPVWIDLEV